MTYERKVKYTTISLSVPLMEKIKEHINKTKEHVSVGDFMRDAVKEKMEREGTFMNPQEKTVRDTYDNMMNQVKGKKIVFSDKELKSVHEFLTFYFEKHNKERDLKYKRRKEIRRKQEKKK